jgi:hypothetical protein
MRNTTPTNTQLIDSHYQTRHCKANIKVPSMFSKRLFASQDRDYV